MRFKSLINILGGLITLLGVTMIIPIIISYFTGGSDLRGFTLSFLICILIGLPSWFFTKHKNTLTNRDGFAIVTFSWIATAVVGSLPFYFSGAIPNLTDSFFESMSGVTTTGASIIDSSVFPHLPDGIESLDHGLLYWRSFIQWIGGMGIIVFYIAILPLLGVSGSQLFKAEVPGPVADKITPRVRETAKFLWIVYLGITLLNLIALLAAGMPFFDSLCHAFTTMPTGGFSIKNNSIGYYDSSLIDSITMFFMFLAGINFTLHFKAFSGKPFLYFKDREFRIYSLIIILSSLVIFINICSESGLYSLSVFKDSLFQTISILSTTGFGTADYELWPVFVQTLLLSLMFVGGMGGSTSGGMKIIRCMLLFKYAALETRRMLHARALIPVRIGKNYINDDIVRNTLGFFLFFFSTFIFATLALTAMGNDLVSSLGAAASAMGNIGPGLNEFGPTDNFALLSNGGKWVLSFCMLLGRLEVFTVVVIFSRTFWK